MHKLWMVFMYTTNLKRGKKKFVWTIKLLLSNCLYLSQKSYPSINTLTILYVHIYYSLLYTILDYI